MKYLSLLIILFSINSFSADYKSAARLKEGDVISAEVFNDILDRIELTLKPIVISDLVGTWSAKQYICNQGDPFGGNNFCDQNGYFTTTNENGVFEIRTDTVTITDNGNNTFNWTSPNKQLFFHGNINESNQGLETGNKNHTCSLSSIGLIGCLFDASLTNSGDRIVAYSNIKRTSPTQLVLFWGPRNGGHIFSQIILDKQGIGPNPPTNFTATLQSGTTPNVTFSWTASDGGADSYTIKSKDSATGTFADLQTDITNIGSFSDSLTSGTRWYRVFAVDSNGTSIGSNVVSVNR